MYPAPQGPLLSPKPILYAQRKVRDQLGWAELRGRVLQQMTYRRQAATVYRGLLHRYPDNSRYHEALQVRVKGGGTCDAPLPRKPVAAWSKCRFARPLRQAWILAKLRFPSA